MISCASRGAVAILTSHRERLGLCAIKTLPNRFFALGSWLINLFDPPPLESMTVPQKAGRVIFLTCTLVIASVLVAMLGALGIFVLERGREMRSTPELMDGLGIILLGVSVNACCVFILVQIKRADNKLVPPKK
jgi:hypothetical protein